MPHLQYASSLDDCEVLITLQELAWSYKDVKEPEGELGGSKDEDKPFWLVLITQEHRSGSAGGHNELGEKFYQD